MHPCEQVSSGLQATVIKFIYEASLVSLQEIIIFFIYLTRLEACVSLHLYIFFCFFIQGSVLNFFLTKSVEEKIGLTWVLWGGAFLCLFGFFAALLTSCLDTYGVRKQGQVYKEIHSTVDSPLYNKVAGTGQIISL